MTRTTKILWLVYFLVLGMLLPHTAWAFRNFEPQANTSWKLGTFTSADLVAWFGAFAFESAIAVLTHKLSKHLETTPTRIKGGKRFAYQYLNPIGLGLMMATMLSALANLAHAVEFGRSLRIFVEWGIPQEVYAVAFGGVLPFVSLIFARVLSNVVETEEGPSPELIAANQAKDEFRRKWRDAEEKLRIAEAGRKTAEERFGAMGDLVKYLFSEDKRQRILFARQQWPALPNSAIAIVADASQSHVSEVLRDYGGVGDIRVVEAVES